MIGKAWTLTEDFVTFVTFVRFLSSVDDLVINKTWKHTESFVTLSALIRVSLRYGFCGGVQGVNCNWSPYHLFTLVMLPSRVDSFDVEWDASSDERLCHTGYTCEASPLHGSSDGWGSGSRHELLCHPGRVCKGLLERAFWSCMSEEWRMPETDPISIRSTLIWTGGTILGSTEKEAPVSSSLLNLMIHKNCPLAGKTGSPVRCGELGASLLSVGSFPSSLRQVRFVGWVAGTPFWLLLSLSRGYTFSGFSGSRGPWCHGFLCLSDNIVCRIPPVWPLCFSCWSFNTRLGEVSAQDKQSCMSPVNYSWENIHMEEHGIILKGLHALDR